MDRKAWIVITLCCNRSWGAILVGCHPRTAAAAPAKWSQHPLLECARACSQCPASGTPAAPAGDCSAAAPASACLEEKVELKNDKVVYTFTTKGGGILTAELLDTHDHAKLNKDGRAAIGAVSSSRMGEDLDYKDCREDRLRHHL